MLKCWEDWVFGGIGPAQSCLECNLVKRVEQKSKGTDAIIDVVLFLIAEVFQVLDIQIVKGVRRTVTWLAEAERAVESIEIHVIQEALACLRFFPLVSVCLRTRQTFLKVNRKY